MAALYNIACCQAKLAEEELEHIRHHGGDVEEYVEEYVKNGLIALAGCLEAGYDDFAQLRGDKDLDVLRKDEKFEGLMRRFEKKKNGGLFNISAFF